MENAIQVRNLTKKYKDFTLDNISFELPCGMVGTVKFYRPIFL